MRESKIEKKLRIEVEKAGGWAPKLISPGNSGVPDRLIFLPGAKIGFVETKAAGKTSKKLQKYQQNRLRELGFLVFELDRIEDIKKTIDEIRAS